MMYRMMGGCLGAAWDGPYRAAYASPAVGGAFARSSIRLGALPEPDHPRWGGAVRLPSLSAWRRRLMQTCVPGSGVVLRPTTEKEDDTT